MKKRNMKKILVILLFSLTLQCGRPCPLEDWKKYNYHNDVSRFSLQTSPKEIPLQDFEAATKLLAEAEPIISEIERDIAIYTNLPGINVNVKEFKLYLSKLKHCACLLRCYRDCLQEMESNSDFDNE